MPGPSLADPQPAPGISRPALGAGSGTPVRVKVGIVIPLTGARADGARYVSVATKSIAIELTPAAGGKAERFDADLTPASNAQCAKGKTKTTCTLLLAVAPGNYRGAFTTYDGLLKGGNAATHPPTGRALSELEGVALTFKSSGGNALNLTLDGVPASAQWAPAASSGIGGSAVSGFTISKCFTSAAMSVYAVDADGYIILGSGAPGVTMSASNPEVAVSATSANTFAIEREAIPNGGSSVELSVRFTPPAHSGRGPSTFRASLTFGMQICGAIAEFPTGESSSVFDIATGPDGALWYTLCSPPAIGRMTTAGAVVATYALPPAGDPESIVKGPDDNMWFADSGVSSIGRVSTAGTVTEFPIPGPTSAPFGIAAGSDGALWFTSCASNSIGRVTTSGSFTQFPVPTAGSHPAYITAGPDGALWFGEFAGEKVARIPTNATPGSSAQISEYPVTGNVNQIVAGPGGALWFAQGQMARIPTDATPGSGAQVTVFPMPGSDRALGVAQGGDGAVWFTDFHNDAIGRISTDGAVTEYTIPTPNAGPRGITLGPDGSIWFTECLGYKIGRLQ